MIPFMSDIPPSNKTTSLNTNHLIFGVAAFLAAHYFGLIGNNDSKLSDQMSRVQIDLAEIKQRLSQLEMQVGDRFTATQAKSELNVRDSRLNTIETELRSRADWMSDMERRMSRLTYDLENLKSEKEN